MNFLFILAQAAAPAASPEAAPAAGSASPWFWAQIIGIVVIFYFLLIYPQRKRAKEQAALMGGLKVGEKVITTSGIHGIITNVKDESVMVKVADNVKIEFSKNAIATVLKSDEK